MDAHYAKDDEGYLVTVPLREIVEEGERDERPRGNAGL